MNDLELLEKAIAIAVEAHRGQKDRYGAPYILHPLRVMARVQRTRQQIVAVLHDVVEDSDWSFEDLLREGFPREVVEAVRALTKREGEDYTAFTARAGSDPLARPVKVADLEDNMDLRRAGGLPADDLPRFEKYVKAWISLTGEAPPGRDR
jgi:(p)ppGpp synthase/HD superfamily hydrolase